MNLRGTVEDMDAINSAILGDGNDDNGGEGIEQGEMPEECKFWERFGWEPSVYATRVYGEWWRLGFWDGDLPET